MPVPPVGPRLVYDPAGPLPRLDNPPPNPAASTLRAAGRALTGYYRDPLSWLALAVTTVVLCYLGGLVLFWFHSVELGEGGPQISWYTHWLLDSTFAFVGLTPALAVILPLSTWAAQSLALTGYRASGSGPDGSDAARRLVPWLHAAVAGVLFALVTTPGPIAHDMIVGRGTWIAERVTALIGDPSAPLTPASEYPPVVEMSQQLGAAVPLYLVLMGLTVLTVRTLVTANRR